MCEEGLLTYFDSVWTGGASKVCDALTTFPRPASCWKNDNEKSDNDVEGNLCVLGDDTLHSVTTNIAVFENP